MKKILCLILFIISVFMLIGCGDNRSYEDFKTLYESTKVIGKGELERSNIFSDSTNPNSIVISYPEKLISVINLQKSDGNIKNRHYMALAIQQEILSNIYKFYEEHNEDFYRIISSEEYSQDDMNKLYDKLNNLNACLNNFNNKYNDFIFATKDGVSDVMNAKIKIYSYELNKVIDKSFEFMFEFIDFYDKYCIKVKDKVNLNYLDFSLDKSLIDISYVIYMENVKSFNHSVGDNGSCDVFNIIESSRRNYDITPMLLEFELSEEVKTNITTENALYSTTVKKIEEYFYFKEIFEKILIIYKIIYNDIDFYEYNNYRMELVNGISYDNYLQTLSQSEISNITLIEDFVDITFFEFIEKVDNIATC